MGANISNADLVAKIQKALIDSGTLSTGGKLNPAQSDKFIDYVIQETVLKDNARVVKFRNETLEIDKIGVGRRVAMPKAEAADPALRRGVNTSKVELAPKTIIVPFEISDEFKELNIEGEAVQERIVRMMATRLANDLEELYTTGDSIGAAVIEDDIKPGGSTTQYIKDSYLALFDGWSRLADGANLVDFEGTKIGLNVFSRLIKAMPTKFRRNKNALRFFMASDLLQDYIEKLSTRGTSLGDMATQGVVHTPFGIKIVEVPLMPLNPRVVEEVTFTGAGSGPFALRYAPLANEAVLPGGLGSTPTTAYVEGAGNDYLIDTVNGTITHVAGGAIGNTDTVKVTYDANPQVLLTHMQNFIVGIGRDIKIEKDRDIFKGTDQFAITAKVSVVFEEDEALVKGYNIGEGI